LRRRAVSETLRPQRETIGFAAQRLV
jgi:hypothetical protein